MEKIRDCNFADEKRNPEDPTALQDKLPERVAILDGLKGNISESELTVNDQDPGIVAE